MSYTPHNWTTRERITKQRLNTLENGLSTVSTDLSNLTDRYNDFTGQTYSEEVSMPRFWQMKPGFFICAIDETVNISASFGYLGYVYPDPRNADFNTELYCFRNIDGYSVQVDVSRSTHQNPCSIYPIFIMPEQNGPTRYGEFKLAWHMDDYTFSQLNFEFRPLYASGSFPSMVETEEGIWTPKVYQFHTENVSDFRSGFILNGSCVCTISLKS